MGLIIIVCISLCIAFFNIFIIHLIKIKFPKAYFFLGEMIITEKDDISILGIITKFCPPLITGIIIGLLPIKHGFEITIMYSFFASFLVVWPVILSGNELLSWEAKKKIKALYLIYVFYITIYIILALFGNFLGNKIREMNIDHENLLGNINETYNSWNPLTKDFFWEVIRPLGGVIAVPVLIIYRLLVKNLNKKIRDIRSNNDYK
jgi:hypothetical protein